MRLTPINTKPPATNRRMQKKRRMDLRRLLKPRREVIATGWGLLLALATQSALAEDPPVCGTSTDEVQLRISVSGAHSEKGELAITLYPDDKQRFLARGGKLARQRIPVVLPVTTACFVVATPGSYAISVYHDEDGDHKLKRKLFGLPDEGYGFSNNPQSLIGLPSLADVRFPAKAGDNPVTIRLIY